MSNNINSQFNAELSRTKDEIINIVQDDMLTSLKKELTKSSKEQIREVLKTTDKQISDFSDKLEDYDSIIEELR